MSDSELVGRLVLFDRYPAEESTVRPFPRQRNVHEMEVLAHRIATGWRGATITRALAKRATELYVRGAPRSAALADLAEYEVALTAFVRAAEAELENESGGARHG